MKNESFYPDLKQYLHDIETEFAQIPEGRVKILHQLGDYVISVLHADERAKLLFICTHNSRRSHFGQLWAKTAARYYGIGNITTYSGGTASTAFNPRAVASLERAGFQVQKQGEDQGNPRYLVSSGEKNAIQPMFSKTYSDPANPAKGFCAIMVCSDADEACPFIPGADLRISLPYDDPKAFDGTHMEETKYNERSRQIAREMFFTFKYIEANL